MVDRDSATTAIRGKGEVGKHKKGGMVGGALEAHARLKNEGE